MARFKISTTGNAAKAAALATKTVPTMRDPPKRANKPDGKKRAYRLKPGTKTLREIRKQQMATTNVIPRASMDRLVREIAQEIRGERGIRLTKSAILALQHAAESMLIDLLSEANDLTVNVQKQKKLNKAAFDFTRRTSAKSPPSVRYARQETITAAGRAQ